MMTQSAKTPVMVLQELTVKRCWPPPEYELIRDLTIQGTHINEFHYRVEVANRTAYGDGSSKQIAKHAAAKGLLEVLAKDGLYHPNENPIQSIPGLNEKVASNYPVNTPVNCIQPLNEFCDENKIPTPKFEEVSAEGPPHCREFTYDCRVASITTRAKASTKKQAKQIAAKEMLDRVKSMLPQLLQQECSTPANAITENEEVQRVLDKYSELTTCELVKPNFSINVDDYHLVFKRLMAEKELNYSDLEKYFNGDKSEANLKQMLDALELKYQIEEIPSDRHSVATITVTTDSPFSVMAAGATKATAKAEVIQRTFDFMQVLMD